MLSLAPFYWWEIKHTVLSDLLQVAEYSAAEIKSKQTGSRVPNILHRTCLESLKHWVGQNVCSSFLTALINNERTTALDPGDKKMKKSLPLSGQAWSSWWQCVVLSPAAENVRSTSERSRFKDRRSCSSGGDGGTLRVGSNGMGDRTRRNSGPCVRSWELMGQRWFQGLGSGS